MRAEWCGRASGHLLATAFLSLFLHTSSLFSNTGGQEEQKQSQISLPTRHLRPLSQLTFGRARLGATANHFKGCRKQILLTSYNLEATNLAPVLFMPSITTTWGQGKRRGTQG